MFLPKDERKDLKMPSVKNNKVTKTVKKTVLKDPEKNIAPIVEEPAVVEEKEISGYLVPILFKREPIDKDIHVADLIYNRWSNSMKLQCFRPNYEADLDTIVAGDISMFTPAGGSISVSKSEAPVSWIKNLTNSKQFSGNPFIATEAQALYEI